MSQKTEPLSIGPLFVASGMVFVAVMSTLVLLGPPVDGMGHMMHTLGAVLGAFAASLAAWGALGRDGTMLWAAAVCGVIAALLLAGSWHWFDMALWARGG